MPWSALCWSPVCAWSDAVEPMDGGLCWLESGILRAQSGCSLFFRMGLVGLNPIST